MTLMRGRNLKYLPHAFTEQGVAMLSRVLRSPRAIEVNIAIMRTFVQLRRLMAFKETMTATHEGGAFFRSVNRAFLAEILRLREGYLWRRLAGIRRGDRMRLR
ncbi:MAG: hypothetical protein A3G81_29560 [Betaproteobacteria bacterium RIFCSPLOWO2_12_FULL_65_14]|nr:MAG: hypothetical protein A3G81_29560 [Betaproteobacteria bacterium RIFCSPLOWO2_12_FULL_65_14]